MRGRQDTLLKLADHLPAEASEALLEFATGGRSRIPTSAKAARPSVPYMEYRLPRKVASNQPVLRNPPSLIEAKLVLFVRRGTLLSTIPTEFLDDFREPDRASVAVTPRA